MKSYTLITFVVLFALLSSCTRYKDIVYLQPNSNVTVDSNNSFTYNVPMYKIQKRDILFIKIISMNKEVTEIINTTPSYSANIYNNEASFYIYGYNVNDSGKVEIPIVGEVSVVDKTLEEAKHAIIQQTKTILKDPTVIVKLISFKFSVLGEVLRPGIYTNFNNQLTVLEAISQAGDISPYGNRRKVMVIRSSEGITKTYRFDLTDVNILKSKGFYLLPNDIVYVEPLKSSNFRNNVPIYSLMLGTLTTFLLVLNYIAPQSNR